MTQPHIADLFAADPHRLKKYSITLNGLYCDYAKSHLDDTQTAALIERAHQAKLNEHISALFEGERVNFTEQRPALHTALRQQNDTPVRINGIDIIPEIRAVQNRMQAISEQLRTRQWLGYDGQVITDVVSIGIGGSDLGPVLAHQALAHLATDAVRIHFLSNIDGHKTAHLLSVLNPGTTLFIVASKSFTTQETLTNANTCKQWLLTASAHHPKSIACHFLAISANPEKAQAYGITSANILPFWDWVGGRYSLWSAIGLPVAIAIGMDNFQQLLAGAHAMDNHFRHTNFQDNMPVMLALLGHYYINQHHAHTHAIIPYDERLAQLPAYIQQLDMESNGKSIDRQGNPVSSHTAPIIWGAVGTNSQHACHQLLHQGTEIVPLDFIAVKKPQHNLSHHHDILMANCLAQAQALMLGKNQEQAFQELVAQGMDRQRAVRLAAHKVISGNKPSTLLLLDEITPYTLGMLIALYEHKVFVQGVLWQINSFDQWGVELGKQLGEQLLAVINNKTNDLALDASTQALLQRYLYTSHA